MKVTNRQVMEADVGLTVLITYTHLEDIDTFRLVTLAQEVSGRARKINTALQPIRDRYCLRDPVTGDPVLARDRSGNEVPGSHLPDPALLSVLTKAVDQVLDEEVDVDARPIEASARRLDGKLPFGANLILQMGPFMTCDMEEGAPEGASEPVREAVEAE